jgi:hypothetical protein
MGLLDRFRPVLTIGAERGELVFRQGDAEVHEQPVVRVAPDGRIAGFGNAGTAGGQDGIQLFTDSNPRADAALRAFCRHHVMLLSPRSVGLRPRIALLESQLRQEFGEHAVSKLRRVLVQDRFVVNRAGGA